jgi:hypothetical protein
MLKPIACGMCGAEFFRTLKTGANKKYCSGDCAIAARKRDQLKFKLDNPDAEAAYRARAEKHASYSRDTVLTRLRKRYPDLPTSCEAGGCGESRVLEVAHKPGFKRNGAWRTLRIMERHMFWLLCPTHHRILDYGIETAEQMGLQDSADV